MDNKHKLQTRINQFLVRIGVGMRAKLIIIFLFVQVIPLILLTVMAWQQVRVLGDVLREIAVGDAVAALNASAVDNIERMSTDAASRVAAFLYARDDDLRALSQLTPSVKNYQAFSEAKKSPIVNRGTWVLAEDGQSWVQVNAPAPDTGGGVSTNSENEDMDGFHYRPPEAYTATDISLYDEVTFIDLNGMEQVKYTAADSPKEHYPMSPQLRNISEKQNTYVKAENYFAELQKLAPGEIYVSDVIGAYVGSNFIGMYTPDIVETTAIGRGYDIDYAPETQAYAGEENPNGQRFEGIVRWAMPVTGEDGDIIGYVSFALNHDHIMELVDHLTPMTERYTQLPSAYEGNYAFIWDYQCRSIVHPRHHSIVGFDPETGEPQTPWLETSIYEGWQASGVESWTEYVADYPTFYEQSRTKKPAAELTQAGLVGLDGRYLNNAPQCTGWMDLTREGGSGSFYILWSGIYKLNTAAAIPYYTGQYAPSEANDYSKRGFGFVAVGSGLEDFTGPATEMETRLISAIQDNQGNTTAQLLVSSSILIVLVVMIAILLASSVTKNITKLNIGINRFRAGERQFRYNAPVKDEFGALADSFDDMADSIVDSVTNSLSITDMDKTVIYMNDAGLEFCQMTLDEIVGTPYAKNSVYPADSPYDPILALHQGREAEIYHLEHGDRYLKATANYLQDKDGNHIGYIIESADVTDMVQTQRRIEAQKSLLDRIFSASPDLIWYMDVNGAYYTVNPRFAAIAGIEPEAFVGKTAEDVLPASIAAGFAENDRKAFESSAPLYSEEQVVFYDGHTEILDSVRTPLYDQSGAFLGILGFARNVSTRVEIEDTLRSTQIELEKAVNEANLANEHKGEFLARMSHEIRTPMNAIIGLTNLVQRKLEGIPSADEDSTVIKNYINQIDTSSQHLLGLLNDILDLSKIEAGHIELIPEAVELPRLAATVASIIRPRCDEKNIRFVTNFDTFSPSTFSLDALRLRQVLINLLGNAVKFTAEGGVIEFSVTKKDQRPGETLVGFSIRDNGIGIKEEFLAAIFESFEQGGNEVTVRHGGTGLGLAISKRIVQMFGSEIHVDSVYGQGSIFYMDIWLKEAASEPLDSKPVPESENLLKGKKMLLVDDVEINRLIVASMLEDTGISIDEAADGQDAVNRFMASPVGYYDIILMDIQMPEMDGYTATAKIRTMDRPDAKTVHIIAQTANAFKEDIDKALSRGMNAHLAKPVERDLLIELLARLLNY